MQRIVFQDVMLDYQGQLLTIPTHCNLDCCVLFCIVHRDNNTSAVEQQQTTMSQRHSMFVENCADPQSYTYTEYTQYIAEALVPPKGKPHGVGCAHCPLTKHHLQKDNE